MKNIVVFLLLLLPLSTIAQSEYYYEKGAFWVKGEKGENPYNWTRAYSEWKIGEQKGEISSARMAINCLIAGKGTQSNIKAAINLINKWYKKDQKICMLGAILNIPRKYHYTPTTLYLQSLVRVYDCSLDDFGVTADINKALFYAKYAKEHHNNAQIESSPQTNLFYGLEGLCYKYGICGYKKDLIQAAKRFNYVIIKYGDYDYSPMYELIESSSSLQELYNYMSETSLNIVNGTSHDMETLLHLAASEGPSKPVRNGYINDFLFKVDKFVDEFWKLPSDGRTSLYNNSDENIKRIYDNSLLCKTSFLQRKNDLSQSDIDTIVYYLKDYPNKQAVYGVQIKLEKNVLDAMEQYADMHDCESYTKMANVLCGLINEGVILNEPTERLRNIQSKLLGYFKAQRENMKSTWKDYELLGIFEFFEQSRQLLSEIRKIKKNCTYVEMLEFDDVEQFFHQYFMFAQVLGFYTDEEGKVRKREENISELKKFIDENPNSIFQSYAEVLLAKELGTNINNLPSAQIENEVKIVSNNTKSDSNQQSHGMLLANYAFSPIYQHSFGLTFGSAKKFGWYINVMTNGRFDFNFDQTATLDDNGVNTEYLWSGEVTTSRFSATIGGLYAINQFGYVYAGVGYGVRNRLWFTMSDQVVAITPGTYKGLALEAGLMFNLGKHILVSGGVLTQFSGAYYEMKLGIGYKF